MRYFHRPSRPRPAARQHPPLRLDVLEDRDVPSATLNLASPGASGSIGGALFTQAQARPTGTGAIDSFVRVQAQGNGTVEQGYNTSARPLAYDENKSPQFTRAMEVAALPRVMIGNVAYREVLLDINQKASASLLSLDALRLYVSNSGAVAGKFGADGGLPGASLRYDMDAGGEAWVRLDARLSTGSGSGDMVLDVPETMLAGGTYFYLYSQFGSNIGANGGFEEWATQGAGGGAISTAVAGSIAGNVYFDGQPVRDGTVVRLVIGGVVVDEVTTTGGAYQFNNLLLDSGVTFAVTAEYTSDTGFATGGSNGGYLAPGENLMGVDIYLVGPG